MMCTKYMAASISILRHAHADAALPPQLELRRMDASLASSGRAVAASMCSLVVDFFDQKRMHVALSKYEWKAMMDSFSAYDENDDIALFAACLFSLMAEISHAARLTPLLSSDTRYNIYFAKWYDVTRRSPSATWQSLIYARRLCRAAKRWFSREAAYRRNQTTSGDSQPGTCCSRQYLRLLREMAWWLKSFHPWHSNDV